MALDDSGGVDPIPKIDSLPNLRLLCKRSSSVTHTSTLCTHAALYRSSKPDRLISGELGKFRKLGIRCIVDFRAKEEYLQSDGHRLLDQEFPVYEVVIPKEGYSDGESVKYEPVPIQKSETDKDKEDGDSPKSSVGISSQDLEPEEHEKRHFLINFFSKKYVFTVFNRLPWHLWCIGMMYLIWDIVVRNNFKNFKKFFATKALNTCGIFGQYMDIVELSQASICSALKLLADPNNLPALINCAHGKDRTGIVSALVLSCLGMSKDYVAEEYSMSTVGLEPVRHLVYEEIVQKYHLGEEFCTSNSDTMRNLLTYIEDRYQSVENYMVTIGFSLDEQRSLKENLEAYDHMSSVDTGSKDFTSKSSFSTPNWSKSLGSDTIGGSDEDGLETEGNSPTDITELNDDGQVGFS